MPNSEIFFKDIASAIQEEVSKEILQKLIKKNSKIPGVKTNLSLGYTVMV
jgi:hypothetical protein